MLYVSVLSPCTECERDCLVEEVHGLHLQEVRWKEVEERRTELEAELSNTHTLLDKETAKYRSAQRQHEVCVHFKWEIEKKSCCIHYNMVNPKTLYSTVQKSQAPVQTV